MQNIFIFGSSSNLAKDFINNYSKKNNFYYVDRKSNKKFTYKDNFYNFDLSQNYSSNDLKKQFLSLINGVDMSNSIFILFSWSGKPRDYLKSKEIWDQNNMIIKNFIQIISYSQPNKVIFLSSAGSIYKCNLIKKFKEIDETMPSSAYGKQKLIAEDKIMQSCKQNNINLVVLRVSSAYGIHEDNNGQGVIFTWLRNAKKNEELVLYNSFDSLINFVNFQQISEAIHFCCENNINGIYNIGSENSFTLSQIYNLVENISNKKLVYRIENSEKRYFDLDVSYFKRKSGIKFKTDLFNDMDTIYKKICI